jgi:hypothetical protein
VTIEQADKVDSIGVDKQTHELVLTISDHLSWENEAAHLAALESKIGAYLDFLSTRQHLDSVSEAGELPVRINLFHKYEPSSFGLKTLQAIERQLATDHIRFSYGPLPAGY